MKSTTCYLSLRTLLAVIMFLSACTSSKVVGQQDESTSKWFAGKEWLNGLPLVPHETIDQQEFKKQYEARTAWWKTAFNYLKDTNLEELKPGKYAIDGDNVFALVSEGPARSKDSAKWEDHLEYIDIHHVIRGKENMGLARVGSPATVITPYDPAKDIAFYKLDGKFYPSDPTMLFIAFPKEAHLPGIKMDGENHVVKKIVIKVRKA